MRQHMTNNPFRPGAGHPPPYLAGREQDMTEFRRLLEQDVVLNNLAITGLRGVGKTVLLSALQPIAQESGWLWVGGSDLSESLNRDEDRLAIRLLTDLSVVTSSYAGGTHYDALMDEYRRTPGLLADKLKAVLEGVWPRLREQGARGLLFVYDEAQSLSNREAEGQYALSHLLDVSKSLQQKELPYLLLLVGLPTLVPKLVEARTYAERMFRTLFLDRLDEEASREAIERPFEESGAPFRLEPDQVQQIIDASGGYPYFLQFICREVWDVLVRQRESAPPKSALPIAEIVAKLETDFFAGRWANVTERQRELLRIIAGLDTSESEFSVQQIVERSREVSSKPFGASNANQLLVTLSAAGLVYKNRHGKYTLGVPLLGRFIRGQAATPSGSSPPTPTVSTSQLRRILDRTLISDSDLDAFCLDHFPTVERQFTNGMDRKAKVNLLLKQRGAEEISRALRSEFPEVSL